MTRTGLRLVGFVVVAAITFGCSNSQKSSGLTLPSVSGGGNGSFSGTLVSRQTGAPVGGASVRLGGVVGVSSSSGAFNFTGVPDTGNGVLTAVLPGFLFRGAAFNLATSHAGVQVEMIQEAPPFSLVFYRQIVRNQADNPGLLEVTRPWTMNPSFYFQLMTLDTNQRVPDAIIDQIKANFTASVPELTAGKRVVAAFDQGDGPRAPEEGWFNVVFYRLIGGTVQGFSSVGGNSGTMTLRYDSVQASNAQNNPYNCASITLAIADHEILHAMGFWHTQQSDVFVDEFSGPGCPGVGRPAKTLYHVNVMYSRPAGNADPDVDPVASAQLSAPLGPRSVVQCDLGAWRR